MQTYCKVAFHLKIQTCKLTDYAFVAAKHVWGAVPTENTRKRASFIKDEKVTMKKQQIS